MSACVDRVYHAILASLSTVCIPKFSVYLPRNTVTELTVAEA